MKKTVVTILTGSSLILLLTCGTVPAMTIDFEGLGLANGDPIPSIGIVSFDASAAVQGGSYAFISPYGGNTGNSYPFNENGNTFITNNGGVYSPESVKTLKSISLNL